MMMLCESSDCRNWAQWRATYSDKSFKRLCQVHKDELQKIESASEMPKDLKAKFLFMGAEPDGLSNS
jgi:hypothetical protein